MFTTSAYGLAEYNTPDRKFGAELGLRLDHYFLLGDGFSLQTKPVLNPRLNIDLNVLKNKWFIESADLNIGTGLFTSIDNSVYMAEEQYRVTDAKPNRAWTSVLGARLESGQGLIVTVEGYYKYLWDRMYIPVVFSLDDLDIKPQFNGEGKIWGLDVMIQKLQSRFWDGWITYSYSWAKYRDPSDIQANMGISGGTRGDDWYFPGFHRFHNLNLILNIKPTPRFTIYTRFGYASGIQILKRVSDAPVSYPVLIYDTANPAAIPVLIEKYYWPSVRDENNRSSATFPMDIKFSFNGKNETGKSRYEWYIAIENALILFYQSQGNTSYNTYTGQVDSGSSSANFEIPIPTPSFGFKVSY